MDTLEEIKQILKENAIQQAKNDKLFAELRISQAETDLQVKETSRKLKEVGRQLGDIGHSSGDAAEDFFYNALEDNKMLGTIKFDEISKNIKPKKHRLEDEYDIFLENGNAVGIIEVKHKVRKDHITKLIDKKAENFRVLFPDYKEYKLFVGIAGLAFDHQTEEYAAENGIVVLKQKGEVMQINSSQMKAF